MPDTKNFPSPKGDPLKPRGGPRPPRSNNRWKKSEAQRFVNAILGTRADIEKFEVDPVSGRMSAYVRGEEPKTADDLDDWMAKHARKAEGR